MNSLDKQIRDRIQAFAEELAELVKGSAVESVLEALGQNAPKSKTTTRKKAARKGRPTKAKKKSGGRIRRSPEQLEALSSDILAHIKANPGQRLEQIGADLKLPTSEMKRPVSLMVAARKLSTKGQRRGTTYYAGKAKGRKKAVKRKAGRKKAARRK